MPRYFFDVQDSSDYPDDIGTECADLGAVRREAMKLLPALLEQEVPDGDRRLFSLVVRDEARRPVFVVTMSLLGMWLC